MVVWYQEIRGEESSKIVEPFGSQMLKKSTLVENEEKEFSLSKALNLGFDIDEEGTLPKGWNLVGSLKKGDRKNPISLNNKRARIELLGDNYSFYTNAPALGEFDKTTFMFSANVRSTVPGVFIQYYDGKNFVNSLPYASKKGEWETLNIEFTVDANAKFHRLYAAILGAVKGNANPSVDIDSVKLQRKEPSMALFEPEEKKKTVVESERKVPELPSRPKAVNSGRKLPELPSRSKVVGSEKKVPERPKAHPLANLLSGASPLKVTSKVKEKEEKVLPFLKQALAERRGTVVGRDNNSAQELLDDEDTGTSDMFNTFEKESVKISLDGQIQQNEARIVEIEKKIQELKPIATSALMGGFAPEARRHDKAKTAAKKSIEALDKEKVLLVKKVEELVLQKKRDEEDDLRSKAANLKVQEKLALMKSQAKKESTSGKKPGESSQSIQKAYLLLKKTGYLPDKDLSQEVDSRASLLSQISRGKLLNKTKFVSKDTSLEISRREIQEQRKTEEIFKKKREEMTRREEELEKERRALGEAEVEEDEWELPEQE